MSDNRHTLISLHSLSGYFILHTIAIRTGIAVHGPEQLTHPEVVRANDVKTCPVNRHMKLIINTNEVINHWNMRQQPN